MEQKLALANDRALNYTQQTENVDSNAVITQNKRLLSEIEQLTAKNEALTHDVAQLTTKLTLQPPSNLSNEEYMKQIEVNLIVIFGSVTIEFEHHAVKRNNPKNAFAGACRCIDSGETLFKVSHVCIIIILSTALLQLQSEKENSSKAFSALEQQRVEYENSKLKTQLQVLEKSLQAAELHNVTLDIYLLIVQDFDVHSIGSLS
jgi:hypothetical protein